MRSSLNKRNSERTVYTSNQSKLALISSMLTKSCWFQNWTASTSYLTNQSVLRNWACILTGEWRSVMCLSLADLWRTVPQRSQRQLLRKHWTSCNDNDAFGTTFLLPWNKSSDYQPFLTNWNKLENLEKVLMLRQAYDPSLIHLRTREQPSTFLSQLFSLAQPCGTLFQGEVFQHESPYLHLTARSHSYLSLEKTSRNLQCLARKYHSWHICLNSSQKVSIMLMITHWSRNIDQKEKCWPWESSEDPWR